METKTKILKNNVLYPELSYKITGLCLQVKKELGRFAKEKKSNFVIVLNRNL